MAIGGLAMLSGCAPAQWTRAETSVETASADQTACRQAAQREAIRLTRPHPGQPDAAPYVGPIIPTYGPFWQNEYDRWAMEQRFFMQYRLTDACMRSRGYRRGQETPT